MARAKESVKALAYLRTSSAANVGADKDSEARQQAAIEGFARRAGYEIVDWFSDPAVSGADAIEARPGFAALLARIAGNGVRTILVETANRFARDLIVQETGYRLLRDQGITLIAVDSPDAFLNDTPTAVLIRQVLGAVAQFEKAMVVSKLKGARDRKRATGVKVEGRRSYAEARPEVVELVKQLRRRRPKGGQRSLREISEELAKAGHLTSRGKPYAATAVAKMLRLVVHARENVPV
jgi:DNA invertase Pin-like site-specific DNA recombinase